MRGLNGQNLRFMVTGVMALLGLSAGLSGQVSHDWAPWDMCRCSYHDMVTLLCMASEPTFREGIGITCQMLLGHRDVRSNLLSATVSHDVSASSLLPKAPFLWVHSLLSFWLKFSRWYCSGCGCLKHGPPPRSIFWASIACLISPNYAYYPPFQWP